MKDLPPHWVHRTVSKPHAFLKVDEPTEYDPSTKYIRGKKPDVEELYLPKLAPGELQPHRWANGDPYDGTSARIGIHDRLAPIITEYVKKLGIWDLMIDTINNNPMPADTTRFYTVKSPYVEGREFTWSAKRPDNFYGSDVSSLYCSIVVAHSLFDYSN